MKQYKMLIDGKLVSSSTLFPVNNPDTGENFAEVPQIEASQVETVQKSASKGFKTWSKMSPASRFEIMEKYAKILEEHKAELIDLLVEETGKDRGTAEYDFNMLPDCLRFFTEEAKRLEQPVIPDPDGRFLNYIQRQPLGVVVGFLAWNFPLLNLGYKFGPALAAGCSVIVKPSQQTPVTSLRCAELSLQAGFPAGVITVITSNDYSVTDPLLTSKDTALFTMIGSTRAGVGAMNTALTNVKHFSVELGGNAPTVVYDDADLEKAVEKIVDLKFANSGQVCVSINRCFVHEAVYDKFVKLAKEYTAGIKLQAGGTEGRTMGPLIGAKECDWMEKLVESAVKDGGKVIIGGKKADKKGFYFEPTIIENASVDMEITKDEIFGPILPIIKFSDKDDIIALSNDNIYGLASYCFTTNMKRGLQFADQVISGSVCINEPHYAVHLPHGGLKQSGIGKDCSKYSLEEYLTIKRVSILVND